MRDDVGRNSFSRELPTDSFSEAHMRINGEEGKVVKRPSGFGSWLIGFFPVFRQSAHHAVSAGFQCFNMQPRRF